ncbi:MAG: hypothetical protein K0R02_1012 [Rickettsiaceae bacterium]|jgi:hypothetical protein|nr:hypothetical protein [Rickettsiaceae bacterium]
MSFAFKSAAKLLFSKLNNQTLDTESHEKKISEIVKFFESIKGFYESQNFKINFQFIKIEGEDKEELKKIMELSEEKSANLSDIYIFDDKEVHFNNEVFSSDSKPRFKHIDKFQVSTLPAKNTQLFQNGKLITNIDKIHISDGFYNVGYGEDKFRLLPGDWVIKEGRNLMHFDYKKAYLNNLYIKTPDSNEKIFPETIFPREQVKAAAKWWAQYLPGYKTVTWDEINKNTKLLGEMGETASILNFMMRKAALKEVDIKDPEERAKSIKELTEKFDKFIEILSHKIYMKELNSGYSDYIQLGHASFYEPPHEVEEALKESGIKAVAYGLFPGKTEMDIFYNGQINVHNKIIYTPPHLTHYTKDNLDLEHAPYMVIKGYDYRIVEIKTDKVTDLYEINLYGDSKTKRYDLDKAHYSWKTGVHSRPEKVYMKIDEKDFKNIEDFSKITDEDLIKILQNPEQMLQVFKKNAFLYYKDKLDNEGTSFMGGIGKVTPENLGNNFFKYTTGPVKVVKVDKDGIIDGYNVCEVKAGEFLIYREVKKDSEKCLETFPASYKDSGFAAYLSDKDGNILYNKAYYPGDELPVENIQIESSTNIKEEILVVGIDRALFLTELCNNSKADGPLIARQPMTYKIAKKIVKEGQIKNDLYFDTIGSEYGVGPFTLKIDLKPFEIDCKEYNKLHGKGVAQKIVKEIYEAQASVCNEVSSDDNPMAHLYALISSKALEKFNENDNTAKEEQDSNSFNWKLPILGMDIYSSSDSENSDSENL